MSQSHSTLTSRAAAAPGLRVRVGLPGTQAGIKMSVTWARASGSSCRENVHVSVTAAPIVELLMKGTVTVQVT